MQNIICILSIAVSATLLTVVWSFLKEIKPPEIFSQPYAEKICQLDIDLPESLPQRKKLPERWQGDIYRHIF